MYFLRLTRRHLVVPTRCELRDILGKRHSSVCRGRMLLPRLNWSKTDKNCENYADTSSLVTTDRSTKARNGLV
jgi:hypothetical protein